MKISVFFGLLFCIAAMAPAQDTRLEHFQCYPVLASTPPINDTVSLIDQFNTPEIDVTVARAFRFCNPTRKIHRNKAFGISDIDQHLTMYATFPRTGPNRVVEIRNQFGHDKLKLRAPFALAVPTGKNGGPQSENLDHFRCYAAAGKEVHERVGLSDQFLLPIRGHVVLDPVAFCNPTTKRHGESTAVAKNLLDHLTCYSMTRTPFSGQAAIVNQFGEQGLVLGPPDTLCVPTAKLGWEEIPDDDVKVPGNPDNLRQP